MGAPSYEESDRERNLDYRIATLVLEDRFRRPNVWSGPARVPARRGPSEGVMRRAKRAEAEALRIEARTARSSPICSFGARRQRMWSRCADARPGPRGSNLGQSMQPTPFRALPPALEAQRFLARARQFRRVAMPLPDMDSPEPNWPKWFLVTHAIELAIKAYIVSREDSNVPAPAAPKPGNHDLFALYDYGRPVRVGARSAGGWISTARRRSAIVVMATRASINREVGRIMPLISIRCKGVASMIRYLTQPPLAACLAVAGVGLISVGAAHEAK
jgi:hypothetical protein